VGRDNIRAKIKERGYGDVDWIYLVLDRVSEESSDQDNEPSDIIKKKLSACE
jgi:hypothetical protein